VAVSVDVAAENSIGEDSVFEGRFAIRGNLRIDGRFEGSSLLIDQLHVGPTGRIKTDIVATSVVVEGVVLGNITAERRILLLSTARVLGELRTPELIIQDGVILEGKCSIGHMKVANTRQFIQSLYDKSSQAGDGP
jgi:cytoskeletal protein CcmA (bactofilin family)